MLERPTRFGWYDSKKTGKLEREAWDELPDLAGMSAREAYPIWLKEMETKIKNGMTI